MKIELKIAYLSFIIFFTSCDTNEAKSIENRLLGTWEITQTNTSDSINRLNNVFEHFTKEITFKDNNKFSLYWMDFDVGNNYEGKYQILQNENRGLPTLVLIPNIILLDKDTIRMNYTVSDIKMLNDSSIQLIYETEFIQKNDSVTKQYVKKEIYQKKK